MGTYRLQRKYREAVQTFLKVKEVDPNEIDFSYHAGVASRLLGDETAANSYFGQFRTDIERRLRSNPEDVAALFDHAIVLARLGDSDRASSLAQTAMELPRSRRSATRSPSLYFPASRYSRETEAPAPDSYFDLGRLLSVQGRTQEAIEALEKAIEKGYRNYVWITVNDDLQDLGAEVRFQTLFPRGR